MYPCNKALYEISVVRDNLSRHHFYCSYFLNVFFRQKYVIVSNRNKLVNKVKVEVNAKKWYTQLDRKFEVDGLEQTGPRQLQKVLVAGNTRLSHQLEQISFNF